MGQTIGDVKDVELMILVEEIAQGNIVSLGRYKNKVKQFADEFNKQLQKLLQDNDDVSTVVSVAHPWLQ